MSNQAITPEIRSEVSSRIIAGEEGMRQLFAFEEVTLNGAELEALCIGLYLQGYAGCIMDTLEYGDPFKSPLGEAGYRAIGLEPPK